MTKRAFPYYRFIRQSCLIILTSLFFNTSLFAQEVNDDVVSSRDTIPLLIENDSLATDKIMVAALNDSNAVKTKAQTNRPMEKAQWIPNSGTATWLALVFPGAGQMYNRKYWKLPIIYGGFAGCVYAIKWNGQMYSDYQQAYLDIMDADPNTKSYMNFLPSTYDVSSREEYLKNLFKKRKDRYRRYRDLSVFCFIGVYLISVIDAYVDAELSSFDISNDLGFKVTPGVFQNEQFKTQYYGIQCSIQF